MVCATTADYPGGPESRSIVGTCCHFALSARVECATKKVADAREGCTRVSVLGHFSDDFAVGAPQNVLHERLLNALQFLIIIAAMVGHGRSPWGNSRSTLRRMRRPTVFNLVAPKPVSACISSKD